MTTTSGGSPADTEATWYRTTPWVLIIGGVVEDAARKRSVRMEDL